MVCQRGLSRRKPFLFAWYLFSHSVKIAKEYGVKILLWGLGYKIEISITIEQVK